MLFKFESCIECFQGSFLPMNYAERRGEKLCVVTAVFGGYDDPPVLPTRVTESDKVKFVLYTDKEVNKSLGWVSVTVPYWQNDVEVHERFKNSIGTNSRPQTLNSMKSKYYKWYAWRLPETRDCRYILFADANVMLSHATNVYRLAVGLFERHPERKLFIQSHQWNPDISVEVVAAKQQQRYVRDRVESQGLSYMENYRFPYRKAGLFWVGLFLYDSSEIRVREAFKCVYRECQLWTLEDQISFPFCMWLKKAEEVTRPMQKMCTKVMEFPFLLC